MSSPRGAFGGYDGLCLVPEYFGVSFDREYAEKLVVEAFEEDTGLKMGSGLARMMTRSRTKQAGRGPGWGADDELFSCVTFSDTRAVFGATTGSILLGRVPSTLHADGSIGSVRGLR